MTTSLHLTGPRPTAIGAARRSPLRVATSVTLALAALLAATPVAAQAAEGAIRVYQPRFIRPQAAMALALQVCGDDEERCSVQGMDSESFIVRGSAESHAALTALLRERDVPPPTQEFRVMILAADDSGAIPDLPAGAREAVEDIRSVLPYTGFSLIDSGWMRTSEFAATTLGEAGSFTVELRFEGDPRADAALLVGFELAHQPVRWVGSRGQGDEGEDHPRAVLGDPVGVMRSQFGIRPGETVVVGTSRINGGNQALVVLLTALER